MYYQINGEDKMNIQTNQEEINHHTMKLVTGAIAGSLAFFTSKFFQIPLESISASYYEGGFYRNFFVGSLCVIASFFVAC